MANGKSRFYQVSFIFSVIMAIFAAHWFILLVTRGRDLEFHRLVGPIVYTVNTLIFLSLYLSRERRLTQFLQVVALIFAGVLITLFATPKEIGGDLMFVLAAIMSYKYGFLDRHLLPKIATIFGILIAARLYLAIFTDKLQIGMAIGQFVISGAFIPVVYWIFEDELQRIAREKRELEKRVKENLPFVEFGRNVSGIVHDFKNDLGLFSMFGQLLRINRGEILDDAHIDQYRGYVRRFGDRIDRILSVTRAAQVTERQEVDLAQLVQAVMYVFQTNLDFRRRVNFSITVPDQPVVIRTFPAEIVSILENIIRNGCEALIEHYGDDEGAISQAFLSVTLEDGMKPSISIVDNGPGIPMCDGCPHEDCMTCGIFEIGKTTKQGGTGLGMITIRNAAAKIGATIRVQSSPDSGVLVSVGVPRGETVDAGIPT